MSINLPSQAVGVWLAEGQSSQRDMLLALQQLKMQHQQPLTIFASHRHLRPEILNCADIVYHEPHERACVGDHPAMSRVDFVLQQAAQHHVKVLLTGRNSVDYEARRQDFEQAGIRLLTGGCDCATLMMLDDKAKFSAFCEARQIPVATGWRFDNSSELEQLLQQHRHIPLCVKPVNGIFAQGFWRLDTGLDYTWDSFDHLYFTEDKKIHLEEFVHAYANSEQVSERPIPMLLMPYLAGPEFSVDVVCEQGVVLAAVTRSKTGKIQHIGYDASVMAVVCELVQAIQGDGIISVQTKADDAGKHHVLEVNSRPSGGIAYTDHAFIDKQAMNLTQLGIGYWAGLLEKPNLATMQQTITPCKVRSIMTSVRIS